MAFEYFAVSTGPLQVNSYLLHNSNKQCIIIDPAQGCSEILNFIKSNALSVSAVVLTHGHFDHITGIPEVLERYPDTDIYIHPSDLPMLRNSEFNGSVMLGLSFSYEGPVASIQEGKASLGGFELEFIHLPGHTPGGCAVVIDKVCFSGDVLFAGSVGRSDFPCGDGKLLIEGIKEKLLKLSDDTTVCPGHGGRTTIGREKRQNPFLV
ncbi:MBL fold metallo-hydrolase [Chitinispirillales bacterium ANBcel5]|uniref:MBL fold metallo-hydrolase n=1 Tax=Cellulosispirillum alkaliphilum TaxID=3039283 RepID=UPI002A555165|nr:MBL fold metallo-hydrolase [Chitinispirillales bacterium ANBcel5]